MIPRIFNNTKLLEKAMDAAWLRNEAIANNMANINTPGYKRKTVAFEEFLKDAMNENGYDPVKLDEIQSKVIEDNNSLSMRLDGNNVDIENETAALAKNFIKYSVLQQSLSEKFRKLRSVIKEGRG